MATWMTTGTYTGNGTSKSISGLGFSPAAVIVKRFPDKKGYLATTSMPVGDSKQIQSKTALETTRITSLDADGFSVGSAVEVNESGGEYYWIAFDETAAEVDVGSYVGTGVAHGETGIGFQPDYLIILPAGLFNSYHRTSGMAGDAAARLDGLALEAGQITSLDADGFSVGTTDQTNKLSDTYHYLAFKNVANQVEEGSYTGDGAATKAIAVAFQPEYVIVIPAEDRELADGSPGTVHRPNALTGNRSLNFSWSFPFTTWVNVIKALTSSGFDVGNSPVVNASAGNYHFVAFSDDGAAPGGFEKTYAGAAGANCHYIFVKVSESAMTDKSIVQTHIEPNATLVDLRVVFTGSLSGADEAILDGIVADAQTGLATTFQTAREAARPMAITDNIAGEIAAITEKVSPVGADVLVIEDSADSKNKKRVQITNRPGGADADAIHDNVAGEIAAITSKATPVGGDFLLIEDSAASNAKKSILISSLPSGGGGSADAFSGFHTTAIINLSETYTDVTIGTERVKTANFTHSAGSAEVTANFTGTIVLNGHLSIFAQVTSSDRTNFLIRFMVDTGGGFAEILGTEQTGYVREKLSELNSQSSAAITPIILSVTTGDIFKMQVRKEDGTANNGVLDTIANRASISLRSL